MASFDLATLARRARNPRRRSITLRDIIPPATLATNLYLATYARVVRHWSEAVPRIMAQYERTLASMTTDAPADVQGEIDQAENGFLRLLLEIAPELRQWVLRQEKWFRERWQGAVLSATGVQLDTIIGPEDVRETLETYIGWNVELIRDVSAQARQRISSAVFAGLNRRAPADEVAKELRDITGMARDRSRRIASDQLSKISAALATERRREAGLDIYEFMHSGKLHPRANHKARNGMLFSENKANVGKRVEGRVVHEQLPPNDRAGIPPFCGCRERGVLVFSFDGED